LYKSYSKFNISSMYFDINLEFSVFNFDKFIDTLFISSIPLF